MDYPAASNSCITVNKEFQIYASRNAIMGQINRHDLRPIETAQQVRRYYRSWRAKEKTCAAHSHTAKKGPRQNRLLHFT